MANLVLKVFLFVFSPINTFHSLSLALWFIDLLLCLKNWGNWGGDWFTFHHYFLFVYIVRCKVSTPLIFGTPWRRADFYLNVSFH